MSEILSVSVSVSAISPTHKPAFSFRAAQIFVLFKPEARILYFMDVNNKKQVSRKASADTRKLVVMVLVLVLVMAMAVVMVMVMVVVMVMVMMMVVMMVVVVVVVVLIVLIVLLELSVVPALTPHPSSHPFL